MMMNGQVTEKIRDILTLRYHPDGNFLLPKITPENFSTIKTNHVQQVEFLLKESIRNFIIKKNPKNICFALSGGIDSITVLALTRELFPELKIHAISFGFDEHDYDIKKSNEISQKFDLDFESIIFNNFMNNLPEQIYIIKEPKINYYWYNVAKKAKEKSHYLFTGDGSDELFAGYVFRYSKYLDLTKNSSTWKDKVKCYLECHNRDWVPDQEQLFTKKFNFSWEKIFEIFKPYFDNKLDPLNQILLADYMGKLMFDWMPSYSKIYHHLNLEGFSPMLDSNLIKYSTSIPIKNKYDEKRNIGKLILRTILKEKKIHVDPLKKGFTPNFPLFWNNFGKELTQIYLNDARIVKDGWISSNWITSALGKIQEDEDIRYMNKILHIMSFEIWYRLFITKELSPHDKLI